MSEELSAAAHEDLSGVRLYKPGLLFLLFIIGGIPLGLAFYGINVCRRDNRCMGIILFSIGILAYVGILISAVMGAFGGPSDGQGFNSGAAGGMGLFLGIFIGLWVLKMEWEPFERAIRQGAAPAKWWPPIVICLLVNMILIVVLLFTL